MYKWLRYGGVLLCFLGFAVVRFRESALFYDPLIAFFKSDYQAAPLPTIDQLKLLLHITLRYFINMLLSLLILWLAFKDKGILKFGTLLFVGVFVLLMITFYVLLQGVSPEQYRTLFYVRRFLIQPLLILIVLPAFYYYRTTNKA